MLTHPLAHFRFQSGSRFARTYYSDKSGGYAVYVAEVGTFDSVKPFWSIDLRFIYKLKLPYGKLFFQADIYNITNNRQATGIDTGVLNSRGEYFVSGDRGVAECTFRGTKADGSRVEARMVDVFTFSNGSARATSRRLRAGAHGPGRPARP